MIELNYSKKQLKPLIEKYNINVESDKDFHEIINLFDGQTTYHLWAIKLYYDNICSLEGFQRIKLWMDAYKTEIKNLIRQNVISYITHDDIEQLFAEMRGLELIKTVRNGASQFNTSQKRIFIEKLLKRDNGIPYNGLEVIRFSLLESWASLFKNIMELPQIRKEKLISTSSALRDINDLRRHMENALTATYEWVREDLLSYVENNTPDCNVMFDKDNVIVLNVPSFKSSQSLCGKGRTCWCLTREERYFKQYVLDNFGAKQYFLFDFNKREDHELAHIGFTVVNGNGITNAHSTSNNNMMHDGILVDGERVNVQTALKKCGIPMSTYYNIEKPLYKWKVESILKVISDNNNSLVLSYSDNNRVIIDVTNMVGLNILLSHTCINIANISIPNNGKVFVMFDFNEEYNSDNACVVLFYDSDRYGTLSLTKSIDGFGNKIDNELNNIGIKENMFLGTKPIDPNIMLHKLINENREDEAIELVKNNDNINVNYVFESASPIFSVIDNKLYNLFDVIVNHKSFNANTTDGYGETILSHLLYTYDINKNENSNDNMSIKNMIDTILNNEKIDLNCQDINSETSLSVACSEPSLLWVVERLVNNTSVNVNIADDFNFTPLGTAINAKNIDAIRILGTRPDLVIRKRDVENAKKQGFNLYDIIEPNDNSEDNLIIQNEINELSEIFAKAFGCL